ncbi:MAG: hypothetical protein C4K48_01110 [Candidatus Thorarchaeota archaeon]|nr:MAG: hypothetical protein C4K48_01110 [Candidatus Thorarchaeota archaeon]
MIINELTRLERFRRVAEHHGLTPPRDGMLPADEIDNLQSQLNAKLYAAAEQWMLPSWAVLTLKDTDKGRSLVTEFSNNMYCNWSLIGGVGTKRYGIVDSRGLVIPRIDCGSIDLWLQNEDGFVFPALIGKDGPQLRLVSSDDQVYEWKTYIKSVEFTRLVYHVRKDEIEYVFNEVVLRNHGLEKTTFAFYVLVRPMSVLGVEPIELIEYDAERRCIYANSYLALMFDKSPSAIVFGEADDSDFAERVKHMPESHDVQTASVAGQATLAMRFDVSLTPAGAQRIFFWSPLASIGKTDEQAPIKPSTEDRDNSIGEWFDFSDLRVETTFPEERLDTLFSQATVSLAMQAFPVMFPEVSHLASLDWIERMRVLGALLRSGCTTVAKEVVDALSENMSSPDGQLDLSMSSPLLWGLHQYLEYTQGATLNVDRLRFLKQLTAGVVAAARGQLGGRLIPAAHEVGESDDEPLQHHLVMRAGVLSDLKQMLWNLAALRSAVATVSPLHESELILNLNNTIEQYQAYIVETCAEIDKARWLSPTDPASEQVEQEILDLLASAALLQIKAIDTSFLLRLSSKISPKRMANGLWKVHQPDEKYSSHLALRLAHFYVKTRQREKVETILNRALEFMSDDFHLPEFVNLRTFGGSAGAGVSVAASADLILLLCDMLVSEEGSSLVILSGVPEDWFTAKRPLLIYQLPLTSGPAYLETGMSANQHQIEVGMESFPEEIEIHVPPSVPMSMVRVYGGSIVEKAPKAASPFLKIVPLSDEVVLTYHK